MKYKKWTKDEDDILRRYYPDQGKQKCAEILGCGEQAVYHRARKLGLSASESRLKKAHTIKTSVWKGQKRPEHSILMRKKYLDGELNLGNTTHGYSKHPAYRMWQSMLARCENKNTDSYPRYGGRGISVCEEWHNVENFCKWYDQQDKSLGTSIDRIDNDGDYFPENCRLVNCTTQSRNKSNNKLSKKQVVAIKSLLDRGRKGKDIANQFGISKQMVSSIKNNKVWN